MAWSSPFAEKQRSLLNSKLPPTLVHSAFRVVHDALAPSTRTSYAAGILRFTQFCDSWGVSEDARMPASAALLSAFVGQCRGSYSGNTVRSWLAGVRYWHILHQAPWEGDHEWVQSARVTANKEGVLHKRPLRAPVSLEHLQALHHRLSLSQPLDAAIWATALVTFFGCRRLGETTVKNSSSFNPAFHVTRLAKISFRSLPNGDESASIRIPWTKTTKQEGASIILTSRCDELCPVKALRNHLAVNAAAPASTSLFAYRETDGTWSHMLRDTFLSFVLKIWNEEGLDHVGGHSFRIGGAVTLLLAGVPPEVVAATGGWTSLAFLLYWRRMEEIIPLSTSKAYTASHLTALGSIFENFRLKENILVSTTLPAHLQVPVPL